MISAETMKRKLSRNCETTKVLCFRTDVKVTPPLSSDQVRQVQHGERSGGADAL